MAPLPPLEDLIPLPEMAARLKVARQTLHNWRFRVDRPLACWRLGGRWYTTEAAVEAFVRAGTEVETPAPMASPQPQATTVARRKGRDPDGDWCRARFRRD